MAKEMMPLTQAAVALGRGYWGTRNLMFRGELTGRKDDRGRWVVRAEDVRRLAARRRAAERELQPAA